MAHLSGNDDETVHKDESYSPSSGQETEEAQDSPRGSEHLEDPDIDASAVKTVPGTGGPDDVGEVDVDEEAIRARIADGGRS